MRCYRYSGEEDFMFPALKSRLRPYKQFKYAPDRCALELEGVFVYKSAYPKRNPTSYQGYLDMSEEYRILGLRAPEKDTLQVRCSIPASLTSRERLINRPNVRLKGRVWVRRDKSLVGSESFGRFDPKLRNKYLIADEIEFLPIEYRSVGSPAYTDFDDMFACVYSRNPEFHEYGPMLLLASLIGSEKKSAYFPSENVGCGLNLGFSASDLPGGLSSSITPSMERNLLDFIRKANIGPINKVSGQLRWNRFLSVNDERLLSRTMDTENEIDWNLVSNIDHVGSLSNSSFITSDINLVFDPNIFPKKASREDLKNLKQTLLFAKLAPQIPYSESACAWIENKTDSVVRSLAKRVEYAPLLFRYRFEPLCDAYLKGSNLADYLISGEVRVRKKDVNSFFRIAEDAACDFADYVGDRLGPDLFSNILDEIRDRRLQDLYRELLVKGCMSEEDMIDYLMDRHALDEEKAVSLASTLTNAEPALLLRQGQIYRALA